MVDDVRARCQIGIQENTAMFLDRVNGPRKTAVISGGRQNSRGISLRFAQPTEKSGFCGLWLVQEFRGWWPRRESNPQSLAGRRSQIGCVYPFATGPKTKRPAELTCRSQHVVTLPPTGLRPTRVVSNPGRPVAGADSSGNPQNTGPSVRESNAAWHEMRTNPWISP